MNSTISNSEISIDGYKLYRLDRLHKKGGGVCAYIRKEIKVTSLKELSQTSETYFQQLWINLQINKSKSLLLCVSYRPPDCPLACFENSFKPNYMQALLFGKPIVILGDLNCNLLKETREQKALSDVSIELNLTQIITMPTRITTTSQSLIDVILTSSPSLIRDSGVLSTPISDHLPIYVILKLKRPKKLPCYITVRSFKHYDPSSFISDLATNSDRFLSIFSGKDVNSKLATFNDILHSTLDIHAPVKTMKVRSRPCPYVTSEIKDLMRNRDRLHNCFLQTRDINDWNRYKESRNTIKITLKNAAKKHVFDEVQKHKNNPGSLWKTINQCIPTKEKESQIYSKDLKLVVEDFNQFFTSVGRNTAVAATRLAMDNNIEPFSPLSTTIQYPADELFNFKPVTCSEVQRIISSMPPNKSPGPDKISPRIIKDCLPVILGPLTDIINCSLASSIFPDTWKLADVIPLLKEGDHELASNNRPLSLLVVASKVCERVALNQFNTYLSNNNRLSSHQSGNRKFHSTETINIMVSDCVLEAMDKKMLTAIILLDLSKAFDSVNHQILLHKLNCIGASTRAMKWFDSYLSGRSQSVRIGSTVSSSLPITHGVPQGAILSPLLFCIYMNDLPSITQSCALDSYVDDSKVFLSFPIKDLDQATQNLEMDLNRVAKWCSGNQLLINPGKTKFLLIGTSQQIRSLPIDMSLNFLGKSIKPVSSAKDLGVIFDFQLTYDCHITHLVSSCMSKLCQINRVKNSFDSDTLSLIITALVINKLLYCSTVWSNTSSSNLKKLQSVQNFACRIITKTRKFDHITPALRQLNWLPIEQLLLFRDTIMAYKCVNNLAPSYLSKLFCKRTELHDHPMRDKDLLNIPLYKTASGQRTFRYRATKIWNDLETNFKHIVTLNDFKKKLKSHMLNLH